MRKKSIKGKLIRAKANLLASIALLLALAIAILRFCINCWFWYETAIEFTNHLIEDIGVAVVPGSSFFSQLEESNQFIRFCFSKRPETLQVARERLLKLKPVLY